MPDSSPFPRHPLWIATFGSVAAIAGGLISLGRDALPGLPSEMALQTLPGLCFALAGTGLVIGLLARRRWHRLAQMCAAFVAIFAAVALTRSAAYYPNEFWKIFLPIWEPTPARMPPSSGLCFELVAAGIFLMHLEAAKRWRAACLSWIGAIVVSVALFAGLGHASTQATGYGWWQLPETAIFSSALFLLLGSSLAAVAWRETRVRWLIGPWISAGFAAGLVLLVAVAALTHRSLQDFARAARHVNRTQEILGKIADIRGSFPTIAGAPSNMQDIGKKLAALRVLAAENAAHTKQLDLLIGELNAGSLDAQTLRMRLRDLESAEQLVLREVAAKAALVSHRTFSMLPTGTVLSLILLLRGFFWLNQEMTERQRGSEASRKSERELALAIEAGQLGIWHWDSVTRTFLWGDHCNALVGLPPGTTPSLEEAVGLVHPDERSGIHQEATRAMENQKDLNLEYRTVWPDGSVRWLNTRGRAFTNEEGKVLGITGIMQDVTQRHQSEDSLRDFNTKLESMVEDRTNVIQRTMTELSEEIAKRRQLEEEILNIGERAQARLGQDLHDNLGQQLVGIAIHMQLLATELNAESHPRAHDAAQLQKFLTEAITTTRNLAKSSYPVELEGGGLLLALHELALRTDMLADISCTVNADEGFRFPPAVEIHLYRIAQESIGNSLKHSNARHITIECLVGDQDSTLRIIDDGNGFDPTETTETVGMGMHLFQYRARLIGAEVTVKSTPAGGCVVTCTLPNPQKPA